VPVTGMSLATGNPTWVAYGCAFAAQCMLHARPPLLGVSGLLVPDSEFRGFKLLVGEEAQRDVAALRRCVTEAVAGRVCSLS
jgi:hypothetical protein